MFVPLLVDSVLLVVVYTLIDALVCFEQCYTYIIIFFKYNFTGEC